MAGKCATATSMLLLLQVVMLCSQAQAGGIPDFMLLQRHLLQNDTVAATMAPVATTAATRAPTTAASPTNLLLNGGFELPGSIPYFVSPSATSQSDFLPGWTIEDGDINVVGSSLWPPAQGAYSVDVTGEKPGTLAQTIATIPNQTYHMQFAFAASPGGTQVKILQISAGDTVKNFTYDRLVGPSSFSDMFYVGAAFNFKATGATTKVTLKALNAGIDGPVVDAISVTDGAGVVTGTSNKGSAAIPPLGPSFLLPQNLTGLTESGGNTTGAGGASGSSPFFSLVLDRTATFANVNKEEIVKALSQALQLTGNETLTANFTTVPPTTTGQLDQGDALGTVSISDGGLTVPNARLTELGGILTTALGNNLGLDKLFFGAAALNTTYPPVAVTAPLGSFILNTSVADLSPSVPQLTKALESTLGVETPEGLALNSVGVTNGTSNLTEVEVAYVVPGGTISPSKVAILQDKFLSTLSNTSSPAIDPTLFGPLSGVLLVNQSTPITSTPLGSFVLDRAQHDLDVSYQTLKSQLSQGLGIQNGTEDLSLNLTAVKPNTIGLPTAGDTKVDLTLQTVGTPSDARLAELGGKLANVSASNLGLSTDSYGVVGAPSFNSSVVRAVPIGSFVLDKPLDAVAAQQAALTQELTQSLGVQSPDSIGVSLLGLSGATGNDSSPQATRVDVSLIGTGNDTQAVAQTAQVTLATSSANGTLGLDPTKFGNPGTVTPPGTPTSVTTHLATIAVDQDLVTVEGNRTTLTDQLAQALEIQTSEALSLNLSAVDPTSVGSPDIGDTAVSIDLVTDQAPTKARLDALTGKIINGLKNGSMGLGPEFGSVAPLDVNSSLASIAPLGSFVLDKNLSDVAAQATALNQAVASSLNLTGQQVAVTTLYGVAPTTVGSPVVGDTEVAVAVAEPGGNASVLATSLGGKFASAASDNFGLVPATFGLAGAVTGASGVAEAREVGTFAIPVPLSAVQKNISILQKDIGAALSLQPQETLLTDLSSIAYNDSSSGATVDGTEVGIRVIAPGQGISEARSDELTNITRTAAVGGGGFSLSPTFGTLTWLKVGNGSAAGGGEGSPLLSFALDKDVEAVTNNLPALERGLAEAFKAQIGESTNVNLTSLPPATVGSSALGDTLVNVSVAAINGTVSTQRLKEMLGNATLALNTSNMGVPTLLGLPTLITPSVAAGSVFPLLGLTLDVDPATLEKSAQPIVSQLSRAAGLVPGEAIGLNIQEGLRFGNARNSSIVNATLITAGGPPSPDRLLQIGNNLDNPSTGLGSVSVPGTARDLTVTPQFAPYVRANMLTLPTPPPVTVLGTGTPAATGAPASGASSVVATAWLAVAAACSALYALS